MTHRRRPLLLSIIGLAGCGKSTFANLVEKVATERGMTHARVKLAAPLYELQAQVYAVAGVRVRAGTQDQVLMEDLAGALRRIEPSALVHNFHRRLAEVDADIVINDDLRDPHVDAVDLRRRGFRIVRVTAADGVRAARLDARGDITRSDRSTAEIDLIEPDVVVDNSGDLAAFGRRVMEILEEWL